MNDEQYRQYCCEELLDFAQSFTKRTEDLEADDPLRELACAFLDLAKQREDLYEQGAALVARVFTTYPDFAPTLPRELLWFFGGNCLHYMADDEIDQFQQLEEMRLVAAANGEPFNPTEARAKLLNLQ